MKYLITTILIAVSTVLFSQNIFQPDKYKVIEKNNPILFEVDIEYKYDYSYKIEKMNIDIDTSKLIGRINTSYGNNSYVYGKYIIKQDSLNSILIVHQTIKLLKGNEVPCCNSEYKTILYVYNHKKEMITDTVLLAQNSMWVMPINSGDIINRTISKSTVYFDKDNALSKIKTKSLHYSLHTMYTIYNLNLDLDTDTCKYNENVYKWKDKMLQIK